MTENLITLTTDDTTAVALVATIRHAVNGVGKYAAYVAAHNVTRENVKNHALALAILAYPSDTPIQKKDDKRTRFGNAVQAAGKGLRSALDTEEGDDSAATDWTKLVRQAVENARDKGEVPADAIAAAVADALGYDMSVNSADGFTLYPHTEH